MNARFWTLRKGLTLSVALNVFLVFLIGSHVWRHRQYERQDKLERFFARVSSELSNEDARKFEAAIDPQRPNLTGEELELKRARQRVVDALKADPFDPEAFRGAVEEARGRRAAFENDFLKSFIEAAQRISPEGRRRLSAVRVTPG
jgi:uncharacterized membrane protein